MKIGKISKSADLRFAHRELEQFLIDFFGKEKSKEYIKAVSVKEKKIFFAAREGEKIVGMASLSVGHKVARLGSFVVAKKSRQSGVGTKLLDKCENVAKKNKCEKIWLFALPTTKAFGFYKKRGYVEEARLKRHFGGADLSVMSKFL
ncbi:GNAT family N-acetyltransferase [Candidatus Micrarchaeota archaeon]|nr:GNAT family N-acetyltransferase [Candidatus Micrarchaeota archaeon]